MTSVFSAETIQALRRPGCFPLAIEVVKETGSTNADLLARAGTLDKPVLLIAESQTAGRGRAGRSWHSAAGSSLTFSLAWKFTRPLHALTALPLAVGVAVCEVLRECGVEARLKWPNDVLCGQAKLAGILIETVKRDTHAWAIIGIGVNLSLSRELTKRIGVPAASLEGKLEGNAAMARLADTLCDALPAFEADGFAAFHAHWNRLDAFAGQPVRIMDGESLRYEGIADGVDEMGRLRLRTAQGAIAIASGDVSLRSAVSPSVC